MTLETKEKKFYSSYSKLSEVKLITIGLASPERIKQWAEKTLPNGKILGEVINANTLHHKTFKPQKGGLFCERIFGPLKDFECACGKPLKSKKQLSRQNIKSNIAEENSPKSILGEIVTKTRNFCNICEVEYTWSVMRRYQLGYIKLISPVTHVWYLKGNPSYLSILLDIKKRHLEYITYCSETLTLENALKGGAISSKSSDIVSSWNKLKEQMMQEKTTKALETSTTLNEKNVNKNKANKVLNKIEKREKLNLKKHYYWKLLYNSENQKEISKDWYNDLMGSEIQLKNVNVKDVGLKGSKLESFKQLKNYAKKLDLKDLKILSVLITKTKHANLNRAERSSFNVLMPSLAVKEIFKKTFIPFYILLNLNILSQKSIYNSAIDTAWKKLSEKALKKALIRINNIFNKVDSVSFKKNWLEGLTNIETLTNNKISSKDRDLDSHCDENEMQRFGLKNPNTQNSLKLLYQAPFYFNFVQNKMLLSQLLSDSSLYSMERSSSDVGNTKLNGKTMIEQNTINSRTSIGDDKKIQDSLKSLKNIFYNLLDINVSGTKFSKIEKELMGSDSQTAQLKNKMLFYKSQLYIEFFTLSNFSCNILEDKMVGVLANLIISDLLIMEDKTNAYRLILTNLSDIFFKVLLKNTSTKNSISSRYKIKTLIESLELSSSDLENDKQMLENNNVKISMSDSDSKLNKKNFKDYRDSLDIFYLLGQGQGQFQSNSKELATENLPKNVFLSALNKPNLLTKDFKNSTLLSDVSESVKFQPITKWSERSRSVGTQYKKLYNNIYCLSHRERWEAENDWNFLYYFMTAPSEHFIPGEKIIPNYKHRFENGYNTNVSLGDSNTSLTYDSSVQSLQKSAFFSGPGMVQQLLNEFNFYEIKKMDKQNRILLYQLNKQIFTLKKKIFNPSFLANKKKLADFFYKKNTSSAKKELKEAYKKRDLLIRRTKLVRKLFIKESSPQTTILTVLPVLPPDLRPIVKMGGQIAASDLNRLYQRVIYRNDRLKKFLKDPATSQSYEMKYAQRLLQEAVDNLIQNGKSGVVSEKDSRGRALKSLSDILKGKQGRFRQYLLGKRVDYSGRSVIVVGPKLKLHECGIPKEMALELYLPFLLKRILNDNLARTVVGAKTLIKTNPPLVWELLREIMRTCPVLLNRAPTLHRLGIQAFQPKLIDGRAILLHPLVCSAFNADFDGDQMAVHIPITVEARAEAWKLMLSRNNILSTATGDPLAIPSQDMVLGCYYLTTNLLNLKTSNIAHRNTSGFYYSNVDQVLKDFELQQIDLHSNIWLKWDAAIQNGTDQEEPIEIRLDSYGNWKEIYNKSQKNYNAKNNGSVQYILTTPGKVLFNQIIQKALKK